MKAVLQQISGWFGGLPNVTAQALPVRIGGADFGSKSRARASMAGFDQTLLWVTVALLAWGLVMVYSATIAMPDNPRFARYAPAHFLMMHVLSLAVGFVAALITFQIPLTTWEKVAPWLIVDSNVLLLAVLNPHLGN